MTIAEQHLEGRSFTTLVAPFSVYCYKCNGIIRQGDLAKKYDGATYTHEGCPTTPLKTYAPHKYGSN